MIIFLPRVFNLGCHLCWCSVPAVSLHTVKSLHSGYPHLPQNALRILLHHCTILFLVKHTPSSSPECSLAQNTSSGYSCTILYALLHRIHQLRILLRYCTILLLVKPLFSRNVLLTINDPPCVRNTDLILLWGEL